MARLEPTHLHQFGQVQGTLDAVSVIGQHRKCTLLTASKEIASRQATSRFMPPILTPFPLQAILLSGPSSSEGRPYVNPVSDDEALPRIGQHRECVQLTASKEIASRNHLHTHTRDRPFQCRICSKSFCGKSHLRVHFDIHVEFRKHAFMHSAGLFSTGSACSSPPQKKLQAGRLQYVCPGCGYSTDHSTHFKDHLRTHTWDRPFQCRICSKSICGKSHLRVHFDFHVDERPFKCSRCSKSFTQKSNMVRHYRIHTGEKPFQCRHCSKRFTNKISLVKHIHTHTVMKPF
ncbi:uncharacterized protein LOC144108287 [Amblyomma americanum]